MAKSGAMEFADTMQYGLDYYLEQVLSTPDN